MVKGPLLVHVWQQPFLGFRVAFFGIIKIASTTLYILRLSMAIHPLLSVISITLHAIAEGIP